MVARCEEDNKQVIDQSTFWDENGLHWDAHRIGWAIAGACAVITVIVTTVSVLGHARHYYVRAEQRQIIRILYMPPVFAIIAFLSYRFFRDYTYYSLIEVIYEAFTLSAFLMLLIQFVASTAASQTAESALERKDKARLPVPLCCWRFRPTKPYFMYTLKWSVLQYTIVRPAASVAGIIAQYYGLLCEGKFSTRYASVYIEAIDFVSISVALMGLIIFYDLTKEELRGRRPLAKFLCIKLIVMFTWYQGFLFSVLQSKGIIHETEFWTATNVANGLNALATCVEMVIFSFFMLWAYPYKEYLHKGQEKTSIWRPLWDSINFTDFAYEIWTSWRFFFDYMRGKPHTRSSKDHPGGTSFGDAFRLESYKKEGAYGRTTKDDSSEVEALNNRSGMQGVYRMEYISSQPGALPPPNPQNNGGQSWPPTAF